MERSLQYSAVEPCFGTVAPESEKGLFERFREELVKLNDGRNYWKTAHHIRISSILNETEMYVYPFRWDKCFGYHLYRWTLWLPLRSLFWKVFSPTSEHLLSSETIETIIELLLPFQGFIPHTSFYDVQEYPLSRIKTLFPNKIPYNLGLYVLSEEIRLEREPYFITPEIETRSLLLLLDILDTMYYHPDPDLRYYTERFEFQEMYRKYVLETTSLLHRESVISSDAAYHRVMKLFQ